jgi:hypothetical protein
LKTNYSEKYLDLKNEEMFVYFRILHTADEEFHFIFLGNEVIEVTLNISDGGEKWIQNFGLTSLKMAAWKTKKEMGIKMENELKEGNCGGERWKAPAEVGLDHIILEFPGSAALEIARCVP